MTQPFMIASMGRITVLSRDRGRGAISHAIDGGEVQCIGSVVLGFPFIISIFIFFLLFPIPVVVCLSAWIIGTNSNFPCTRPVTCQESPLLSVANPPLAFDFAGRRSTVQLEALPSMDRSIGSWADSESTA